LFDETGRKVVFLPTMQFQAKSGTSTQDLLFVPFHHSGYDSRWFFTEQLLETAAQNWKQHNLIGRTWWAPSFCVNTNLSWRDQVLQHIKAVS
jgi:hypothetical protein